MMNRRVSPAQIGRLIRQARQLGLETTGIVVQPTGAIELQMKGEADPGCARDEVADEIARHFAKE